MVSLRLPYLYGIGTVVGKGWLQDVGQTIDTENIGTGSIYRRWISFYSWVFLLLFLSQALGIINAREYLDDAASPSSLGYPDRSFFY